MGDASYGNAMTEIALALAMAFFAIMVLTMVSMGAPAAGDAGAEAPTPVKLVLAPPAAAPDSTTAPSKVKPTIVVFWNGQFYDQDLKVTDVTGRTFDGQVILALSPDLPMAAALDARTKVRAPNIVVSTLDARWLDTIRQAIAKE